ncbi:glycosyltransferase [Bdellovibrio sp. KM01]|uniref:glycosyltransferase n=1 Tax=Bdellovibrio sp. KM01 TaxID=2748865 RepID=UPI0015E970E7|nr:glycosyltransferase [Bdellovibrio sp. KM01]QLY27016.1 phage adsorption protein NrfB [Bdellovibrio sp. KM01]
MENVGLADLFSTLTYSVVIATSVFILDDLFIDLIALIKRLRPLAISKQTLQLMKQMDQKSIAIMIANWKEAEVIGPMIRGNIRGIDYHNYKFFLGVYPNDTATWEEAARLEKLYPDKVTVVVNSEPGPTSKGQMLNEIARQILESEKQTGKRMDLFLLQDSEDVLHPHAFSLLNYFSREADFIQIPVFSFDVPKTSLVGGVYIDEFSESHTKDLLVRQALGAAIPSAGVGTCISREFVKAMMLRQEGQLMKEDTLTEDYHLGITAKPMGFKSRFVCAQLVDENGGREFIATREYFPNKFTASVRQKSRWTLGIAYQGLANLQWSGGLTDRYFLLRDRKGPACSVLTVLSLVVLLGMISLQMVDGEIPPLLRTDFFSVLLSFNALAMFLRIMQRMSAVNRVNDFSQAAMVPVRWLVANAVNVLASLKAHLQYRESVKTGKRPVWIKTEHQMPAHFGMELSEVEVQVK